MRSAAVAFGVVLFAAGCGSVVVDQPAAGAGGAGGASASATTDSATTGGTGGQGPLCDRTTDRFDLAVQTWDGLSLGCGTGLADPTGDFEYEGALSYDGDGQLTLDSCPPNVNCAPQLTTIRFSAPGLVPWIPSGIYAKVLIHVAQPMGCEHSLVVLNLPEWAGNPNPYEPERKLWLAAADGTLSVPAAAPYGVEKQPIDCVGLEGNHLLRFHRADDPAGGADVPMGVTASLPTADGSYWLLRNLRSYSTGAPDDYWDWAYWIAQPFPPD